MLKNCLLLFASLFCVAQTGLSLPKEITVVKGVDEYAPYEIKLNNGKYGGIYMDTIKAVAKKIGVKLNFKEYPWARCQKMIKKGEADAIMTPFKNSERLTYMYYANEPLAYENMNLFTYKGSGIKYDGNLKSLKKYKIGVARGYSYGPEWDKIKFPKKSISNSQKSLIKKLAAKRIQLTLGTKYILQYIAKKENLSGKIIALEPPLSKDGGYIAFSKKKGSTHKELAEAFAKAIKEVKATPQYKEILKKYGVE